MKNKITILIVYGLLTISFANAQNQWVAQNSGTSAFLTSVYFVSADTGWVCSQAGDIIKTTNGGANWSHVGMGPGNSLFFLNAQKGFGAGEECLLKTTNGGNSWDTAYKNTEVYWIIGLSFPTPTIGYGAALDQGLGSYVLKSANSGNTWDTVYHHPDDMFQSIFFVNSQKGFIGGFQGFLYKTEDGGATWLTIDINSTAGVAINSVYFPTPDTGYVATDVGGMYRTTDGGITWSHLSMAFPPALYSVWFTDANHGFVGGGDGISSLTLYKTSNAGNSWTQSAVGAQTLNAIFFVDTLPGYAVGTDGKIIKYAKTSGISDNNQTKAEINILPNPATTTLIIDGPLSNATTEIYDISGKLLLSEPLTTNQIDISTLAKGLYLIKLSTEEGSVVRKFVKE